MTTSPDRYHRPEPGAKGQLLATWLNRPRALDLASRGFARCMLSDEGREGVTAFLQKRKPSWANN